MNDHNRYLDRLVDDAIREFPLEPVPAEIYSRVMERVQATTVRKNPGFSWFDFSLSAILALVMGFFLDLAQGYLSSPYWSARMRVEVQLAWRDLQMLLVRNQVNLAAGLICLATVAGLLLILAGVYRRQSLFAGSMSS